MPIQAACHVIFVGPNPCQAGLIDRVVKDKGRIIVVQRSLPAVPMPFVASGSAANAAKVCKSHACCAESVARVSVVTEFVFLGELWRCQMAVFRCLREEMLKLKVAVVLVQHGMETTCFQPGVVTIPAKGLTRWFLVVFGSVVVFQIRRCAAQHKR